eukprot:TRINITY_DN9798_c0_g1_i1.p1 TRINITY_DN9798_c0_g1~~TRINITY_DN9798_c0_g1_i1.p1  ORF type:complete len:469 (+),score=67.75 TRINITY_DN9798_c0_g1_i1:220-1626(+)
MPGKAGATFVAKIKAAFASTATPLLSQGKAKLSTSGPATLEFEREHLAERRFYLHLKSQAASDVSVDYRGFVNSQRVEQFQASQGRPRSEGFSRYAKIPTPEHVSRQSASSQGSRAQHCASKTDACASFDSAVSHPAKNVTSSIKVPVVEVTVKDAVPVSSLTRNESTLAAFGRDIVAGSASGIAITFVGHPLDTIKTRLQAQSSSQPLYKGTWDCARQTFQQEGLHGLYRGAASPLSMYILYSSVYYSAYIQARRALGIADRSQPAPWYKVLLASTATGVATTFVRTPMDLLKTQAQTLVLASAGKNAPFQGMFPLIISFSFSPLVSDCAGSLGCAAYIMRTQGAAGFFGGFTPTLLRQVVGASAWFFPYELLKSHLGDGPGAVFLCGGLASWIYWTSIYPIDAVKTRMQSALLGSPQASWFTFAQTMLRTEGPAVFFRGFTACLLRAFPANAAGILAYETVRQRLQ